ncbi:hypothetical protein SAMN04488009_2770 [Maribacter sedimenticola]|uniref:Uncharacterized protein n=1 Tax=Maribacter sedimenticola TaxID=228956 RepID=A0ABY1SJ72_9FLAO|nr:hypothetical protein [Maribacter sedimenticola]SNR60458.1 hypothetical protein SAMN04488009_2770 [Maribacter sedimenticola]
MVKRITIILLLIPILIAAQSTEEKDEYITVDNISLNKRVYKVKVKNFQREFKAKICTSTIDSCHGPTQGFNHKILPQMLADAIIDFTIKSGVDSAFDNDSLVRPEERVYLEQLLDKVNSLIENDKSEVQKTTEGVDKFVDEDAATIVLKDKTKFLINSPSKFERQKYYRNVDTTHTHQKENLILNNAVIVFFNNKASAISVEATIECKNSQEHEIIELYNYKYSIPLRAFNFYDNASKLVRVKYVLTGQAKNGEEIEVHVNDIFDYKNIGEKNKGNFGFSIANQRFRLANGENESNSYKVVQRRFFDFFTAIIYSDLMGFNTENSNSLINAQADLIMPLNLGNWAKLTALKQFKLTANVALNNSFENDSRFINFSDTEMVSHFDLMKKNNLNAMIGVDVLSFESKGWFSTYSLGYNLGFYRTGFQYSNTQSSDQDVITKGQVLSISHGPYVNFEFRPQDNFGADIMLSLEEFNLNDQLEVNERDFRDDIIIQDQSNSFLVKHNLVNVSTNFYWLTNPGKTTGGVYARVGVAYHTASDAIFPQVLVGYATNLTSFVNRFKPKSSTTPDENK